MKQVFQQLNTYRAVAVLLAAILLFSVGVALLSGGLSLTDSKEERSVVLATTYPLYVAAQNILGEDTTVALSRLDGAASGCLHDYQLSPADRKAVQDANLILMNGAGAESFLQGIVEESKCVETSEGLDLLCVDHHHEGEEDHHHEEYNEHVWLSPTRYMAQVRRVYQALCELNPGMTHTYAANLAVYLEKVEGIRRMMETWRMAVEGRPCVLFHDSMAYFAADLGLDVKLTLSVEGESGLSAHHLAQVEALAAEHPDLLLLYDTQYALRYEGVAGIPLLLDTAVRGEGSPEDWINAMAYNRNQLLKIIEERGWSYEP